MSWIVPSTAFLYPALSGNFGVIVISTLSIRYKKIFGISFSLLLLHQSFHWFDIEAIVETFSKTLVILWQTARGKHSALVKIKSRSVWYYLFSDECNSKSLQFYFVIFWTINVSFQTFNAIRLSNSALVVDWEEQLIELSEKLTHNANN